MSRKTLCSLVFGLVWSSIGGFSLFGGSLGFPAGGALLAAVDWFDGNVENLTWPTDDSTSLEGVGGEWTNNDAAVKDGATYDTDQKCLLDTSANLAFEPTTALSADFNTITINAEIMFEAYEFDGGSYPEVPSNSKGAVSVFMVEEADATNFYFYGLAKMAEGGTNGWTRLTGDGAEAAASGPTAVSICLTYDINGDIVVNYKVGDTELTLNDTADIPFEGNGLPNMNVASVGLKNAVEVDSVEGEYQENNFDPTVDFGDYSQVQGVNFTSNTLTFAIDSITTNRNLGTITYGVIWNGKSYTAVKDGDNWVVELTDPSDFAASNVIENLDINIYYHPYGSNDEVRVTNSVGKVTIFQGAEAFEAVAWIASKVESDVVVPTGGTWDVTPEVTDGKMAFEDECKFSATSAATQGRNIRAETVVNFSEPNDLKVSFDDLDSVPHGAFTLVQTVGDDPDAAGAEFGFAYYGADGWKTNADYEAALNTKYIITVEFDYAEGVAIFSASNTDENAAVPFAVLGTNRIDAASTLMQNVGFLGAGLVERFQADEMKPVADAALVKDGDGNKFANLGDALASSNKVLTLLWDQTFDGAAQGKVKIDYNGYTLDIAGNSEQVGDYIYFSLGGDYVANACGTNFFSLAAAFDTTKSKATVDAGAEPDIVTLMTNLECTVEVASDRSFVFDLNNLPISTNTTSGVTNVFIIAGDLIITNSAQNIETENDAGGESAIVKGTIILADGAKLNVWGGYFSEKLDTAWIPSGLENKEIEIAGVTYFTVITPQGEYIFWIDDQGFRTLQAANDYLNQEGHEESVVIVIKDLAVAPSNNNERAWWNTVLAGEVGLNTMNIPGQTSNGDCSFVISNETDVSKLIEVTRTGQTGVSTENAYFDVTVTTKDKYAYENLRIGGVDLSDKTLGGEDISESGYVPYPLSDYVEITDAFIAPSTSVDKVEAELLKARPQGDGSNGLSLFANWVLGIPVVGEDEEGVDDIYDDHDGQPLMSIPAATADAVGGSDDLYVYLPFDAFGWTSVWTQGAAYRADDLGYSLQVSLCNVVTGTRSGLHGEGGAADIQNATPLLDVVDDDMQFHVPRGTSHSRVDLLIAPKE